LPCSPHCSDCSSPPRPWPRHLFPSGKAAGATYDIAIGAVKNCDDADACFVAEFSAARGGKVAGKRVTVPGASSAGFFALSCGASCSPPQIMFLVHGVLYTIQANLKRSGMSDKAVLIAAAKSAIAAGPR
jgi:hypothetical protein